MAVDGKLALPRLDIVEHRHRLFAHDRQPPLAIGVEPRSEEMAAQIAGKAHVEMREIRQMIEQRRALPAHLDRVRAGDGEDHRQIVRSEIPKRVVLGVELAEAETVGVDVAHAAEFAGVDQRLQPLEAGMEAQDVTGHEHPPAGLCGFDGTRRVLDGERDRLFDQHVLAVFDRADRGLGMELRRQCHDDRVDVVAGEDVVDADGQTAMLGREAFRACGIGIRHRLKRAERLERSDMVRSPISASEDGDARFHLAFWLTGSCADIMGGPAELNPCRPRAPDVVRS